MTAVGRTLVREHVHRIDGTPAEVFPLLCPVREVDWIDGWAEACTLVQTASGVAEEGCVFLTADHGRPDVTWVCTRHEPDHLVEYVRVWPGEEVVTLTVCAEEPGSRVDIRHTAVPLPGFPDTKGRDCRQRSPRHSALEPRGDETAKPEDEAHQMPLHLLPYHHASAMIAP